MRSTLVWLGVLLGSVGLGVGMYTFVVAPVTDGMTISGTTAAPEPRPTVLTYKTKVVKDPPKTQVVEAPVEAPSGSGLAAPTVTRGTAGRDYENTHEALREPTENQRESNENENKNETDQQETVKERGAAQYEHENETAQQASENQREATQNEHENETENEHEDD